VTERLAILQSLTARLARTRDEAAVAKLVLGEGLAELGGDTGSLCLLTPDGDELEIVAESGYPADVNEAFRRFSLDAPLPASDAVRTGESVFIETSAELEARYPIFLEAPVVGDESVAIVPLIAEEDADPFGALVLGFTKARRFDAADRAFLEALAAHCALAIARSRLYAENEAARSELVHANSRLRFLADASAALATDLEVDSTLARVTHLVAPRIADWCSIYITDDRGHVQLRNVWHADPARLEAARDLATKFPPDLSAPRGIGAVVRTGEEDITRVFAHDDVRKLNLGALILLPLNARGQTIGVMALVNDRGRDLDDDALTLGRELAGRAATAIDNARLYAERTRVARSLQAALLPPALPTIPGVELAATYSAAGRNIDAGGDFYDAFPAGDGRWVVAIGDVCGKGPEAASITGLVRHTIRAVAIGEHSPAAILRQVHAVLVNDLPTNAELEPRFCTAVVVVLEPRADGATAVVACAGHPLPLVRRADGAIESAGAPGLALGLPGDCDAIDQRLELAPSEAVVLFTDGITERHDRDRFFGAEGIGAVLDRAGIRAGSVIAALDEAARTFVDEQPHDDMAALALTVEPARRSEVRLDGVAQSASDGRRFVSATLDEWEFADQADDAALAASELITNAALHGGDTIVLRVFDLGDRVRIEVFDDGTAVVDATMIGYEPILEDAMTGRGLHVVATLASRWGIANEATGKTAWCELRRGADSEATSVTGGVPATLPDQPAPGYARVVYVDLPVRLVLASELHLAGLVREAQLAVAGANPAHPVASQVRHILEAYGGSRSNAEMAARAAAERGEARVTVASDVPVRVVSEGKQFLELMDTADELCRNRALLTLPSPADVRAFRVWCLEEAIRQVGGGAPRPCPLG